MQITQAALAIPALLGFAARFPGAQSQLALLGLAFYAVGAVFFLYDNRLRYGHFVWHLFVLTGSACHFVAVLQHAPVS